MGASATPRERRRATANRGQEPTLSNSQDTVSRELTFKHGLPSDPGED